MAHQVTLVPGDSTGPEHCHAVQRILAAAGVDIEWDEHPAVGGTIPPELMDSARRTKVVLMGHQHGKRDAGLPAPIVSLRRQLGVFAALRPAISVPALQPRFPDVDLVVVRETTEDIYASLEHESIPGVFESLKVTTRAACERIARFAYEVATRFERRKVTIVHKANILKKADGLFLSVCREIGAEYPDIETEDVIVDALCMKLALTPESFDVLLCGNLFGDIVGDLVSGLVGGRSNCPSVNVGPKGLALFSTGHGDPLSEIGTGRGNPLSLFWAAVLMLRQLEEDEAADRVRSALEDTLHAGIRPIGAGGEASSNAFAEAVAGRLG